MKAVFSNLLALTLVASHVAPVALAAPVKSSKEEHEARSLKAVGTAIAGGLASGVAGAAAGHFFGNKRSLTAIENFFGNLFNKRDVPSGLMVDTETGIIYMEVPDANEGRSLKALGTALAGGVASLAAGAAANHFLGNKRSESGVLVDTETGTIYMDIPDKHDARSLKAVGVAVAGGVASGVAGAVASNIFGRDVPSGLFVDTESGVLYKDVPDVNEGRSLKAVGAAVAGGVASLAAGAAANHFLGNKRSESGVFVDTETGTIYADVPDANEARSLKAVGVAVAGGIASGVAGAAASSLFGRDASDVLVDTETGVIYMDVPEANEARSLKAVGVAVAGGIASGVAGAAASSLFSKREPLFVDTETGTPFIDVADAPEARSLKAVGVAVAGGIASGVAGAAASSLFGRDASDVLVDTDTGVIYMDVPDTNEARSLKAVGAAVAGGIASGVAGAVASDLFNKRAIDELD